MTEERRKLVEAVEDIENKPLSLGGAFTSGWDEYRKEKHEAEEALRAYDAAHSEEVDG